MTHCPERRRIARATDLAAGLGRADERDLAAATLAEHLINVFARAFQIEGVEIFIGTSIGISVYPNDGADAVTLTRRADAAMYHAKEQGRNNFQFFSPAMNRRATHRLAVETKLRRALERNEFMLYYQPQIDLETDEIVCVEALLRWRHPEDGLISPSDFIPVAEETGLIVPIGEWVLFEACAQSKAWQDRGYGALPMAVNFSGRQFGRNNLATTIAGVLEDTGLRPNQLEIEITESVLMDNTIATVAKFAELRAMGVQIAIDDFGTGYSSMGYLKRFPINRLKIDQSFVRATFRVTATTPRSPRPSLRWQRTSRSRSWPKAWKRSSRSDF